MKRQSSIRELLINMKDKQNNPRLAEEAFRELFPKLLDQLILRSWLICKRSHLTNSYQDAEELTSDALLQFESETIFKFMLPTDPALQTDKMLKPHLIRYIAKDIYWKWRNEVVILEKDAVKNSNHNIDININGILSDNQLADSINPYITEKGKIKISGIDELFDYKPGLLDLIIAHLPRKERLIIKLHKRYGYNNIPESKKSKLFKILKITNDVHFRKIVQRTKEKVTKLLIDHKNRSC